MLVKFFGRKMEREVMTLLQSYIIKNDVSSIEELMFSVSVEFRTKALKWVICEAKFDLEKHNTESKLDAPSIASIQQRFLNCQIDVVKLLLKFGAEVDVPCPLYTVYSQACEFASVNIVKLFFDHGADNELVGRYGLKLIQLAFCSGDEVK